LQVVAVVVDIAVALVALVVLSTTQHLLSHNHLQ
jgi:hypothetical protein